MLQHPICKDRTQMAKFKGLNSPKEVDFHCKSPLKGHTTCEFTPVLVPGCRNPLCISLLQQCKEMELSYGTNLWDQCLKTP